MVAGVACSIGAVILCIVGIDVLTFVMPGSSRPGMSGSWDPVKLAWMGALCVLASLFHGANAWRIFQSSSRQRAIAEKWSPFSILLWWAAATLGLLVYYPLPYFHHHIDRFFLILSLTLGWGVWMFMHPVSLESMLESRFYGWVRLLVINGLITLVLAESVMRLTDPIFARSGLFSDESNTPGGGIPNQVVPGSNMRTNSLGFRDRERTLARASRAPRVVALGDSFTWGAGVSYEETFTTLVEHGLGKVRPGAEVVNLGLIGYQPSDYLSLLKAHGLEYQPDLVLVNLYVGNDLMPAQGMQMIVAGQRHWVHIDGNWFHDHLSWDHWYLYHVLTHAYILGIEWVQELSGGSVPKVSTSTPNFQEDAPHTPVSFSGWKPRYVRMIQGTRDQYLKRDTPPFLTRWKETRGILENLDVLLREVGIPWVLVLLPAEEQVDQELQRLYREMNKDITEEYDFDKPQRVLREWSRERGVRVIDLAPRFRVSVSRLRLYNDNDVHWSYHGHALAASEVLRELEADFVRTGQAIENRNGN